MCHVHGFVARFFYTRLHIFLFVIVDQAWKKLEECTIDGKRLEVSNIFMRIGAPYFLLNLKEKRTILVVAAFVEEAFGVQCRIKAKTAEGTMHFTVRFQLLPGPLRRGTQLDLLIAKLLILCAHCRRAPVV